MSYVIVHESQSVYGYGKVMSFYAKEQSGLYTRFTHIPKDAKRFSTKDEAEKVFSRCPSRFKIIKTPKYMEVE